MRKRQKMVVAALILGGSVLFRGYSESVIVAVVTILLYIWALKDGLSGYEWGLIPLPGVMFSLGFMLFVMLLPNDIIWSGIYAVIFALGHYFLLLTQNIFSVAAIRTIGLYRAAMAVGFVMTIVSGFFLANTVLTFKQDFYINGVLMGVISFLLYLPALWSVELAEKLTREVVGISGTLAVFTGLFVTALAFWPAKTTIASIFVTTVIYVFLGLSQHLLADRLNRRNALEYLTFGVVVLVTMLVTTW